VEEGKRLAARENLFVFVKLELEPTHVSPDEIAVTCPLAPDMLRMLQERLSDVLQQALSILQEEGIDLNPGGGFPSLPYQVKVYHYS
jgi:hypothetical protein